MNDAKPRRKPGGRPRRSGVIAGDPGVRAVQAGIRRGGSPLSRPRRAAGRGPAAGSHLVGRFRRPSAPSAKPSARGAGGDTSGLLGSGRAGLGGGHFPPRMVFPCQAECGVRWLGVPLSAPSILCSVLPQGGQGGMHLRGQSPSAGTPRNPIHTSGVGFSKASPLSLPLF